MKRNEITNCVYRTARWSSDHLLGRSANLNLGWLMLVICLGVAACDNNGLSDNVDQCPKASAGATVDVATCESAIVVTDPDGYCADSPAGVTCSRNNNFDSVWEHSGDYAQVIRGDIIAMPFTTRDSSQDGGQISVTSPEPGFTDNRQFWMWISKTPGGQALDGAECSHFMARARGGMYWSQNSKWISGDRICYLGPSETLLYLNFTACMSDGFACMGPIASQYSFNVRRSYKVY